MRHGRAVVLLLVALVGCGQPNSPSGSGCAVPPEAVAKATPAAEAPPAPRAPTGEKRPAERGDADQLWAGVAKIDITNTKALPVNDPLYVKALVLRKGDTTMALVTLDAVAVGEIGYIPNDYLGKVRS